LGCYLAAKALRNKKLHFGESFTVELLKELKELKIQSKEFAKRITRSVKGVWYNNGIIVPSFKRRNFNIGIDDGFLSPTLLPGIGDNPKKIPYPTLESFVEHEFTMDIKFTTNAW
jgi:hypothetical protein